MNNIQSKKEELEDKTAEMRTRIADRLESAAHSIRAAADEGASALNDLADQAGKKLDNGAARVRGFADGRTGRGLTDKVRANPISSLAVATAVGLVAGITWRASR